MGVRTDNYLDETFAVAVSLEVLLRLGCGGYMLPAEGHDLQLLPYPVQQQVANAEWGELASYWKRQFDLESGEGKEQLSEKGLRCMGLIITRHRKRVQ